MHANTRSETLVSHELVLSHHELLAIQRELCRAFVSEHNPPDAPEILLNIGDYPNISRFWFCIDKAIDDGRSHLQDYGHKE
jgi:hypothetical protein